MASGAHYHFESMRTARLFLAAAVLVVFLAVVLVPTLAHLGGYGLLACVCLVVGAVWLGFVAFQHAPDAGLYFEHDTRRKFKAVCKEKNLARRDDKGRYFYPSMTRLIGGGDSWSVTIRPMLGQNLADWQRAGDSFAMAYGVVNVRFAEIGGGLIRMTAGYRPMEAREFVPVVYPETDDPGGWRARLASVPVGNVENGGVYLLPLLDSHTLIAGITGAGKGSVIWSALLGLAPAIRAGVVQIWGFDPKKMELSIGRGMFGDRYANDPEGMIELLERAHLEMLKRADELGGRVRRFEPSTAHPFNLLVIDELGYLSALLPDRKLRERADKALQGILTLGRAAGYGVIGALQDPRKETLSYRDLFPTRVAMKLPKPMVDLVLGHGMHEAGALCDLIPDPKAGGAGVAFVLGEGASTPVCVRMTWCSDETISAIAGTLGDGGSFSLPIGA